MLKNSPDERLVAACEIERYRNCFGAWKIELESFVVWNRREFRSQTRADLASRNSSARWGRVDRESGLRERPGHGWEARGQRRRHEEMLKRSEESRSVAWTLAIREAPDAAPASESSEVAESGVGEVAGEHAPERSRATL